jgi:hypothetical protein
MENIKIKNLVFLYLNNIFNNFIYLYIYKKGKFIYFCNPGAFWNFIYQDFDNYRFAEFILIYKNFN